MPIMELHLNPIRYTDGTIVGETLWMPAKPPKEHIFGQALVDSLIERGVLRYEGSPVTLELHPDPGGPMSGASNISMSYPGDKLVLTSLVGEGKSPVEFTFRITHFPIPQNWRQSDTRQAANDDSEQKGVRIAPEFAVELVT